MYKKSNKTEKTDNAVQQKLILAFGDLFDDFIGKNNTDDSSMRQIHILKEVSRKRRNLKYH